MARCDKCGEEFRGGDLMVLDRHTACKGDAAWTFAKACGKELFPGRPWSDAELCVLARRVRLFLREQVFAMGDDEVKRLLGETAYGSFADRGRAAAKAALNQAQLTVLIEKVQAAVDARKGPVNSIDQAEVKRHAVYKAIDALETLLPKRERPERPAPGASETILDDRG